MNDSELKALERNLLEKEIELKSLELKLKKRSNLSIAAIGTIVAIIISVAQIIVSFTQVGLAKSQTIQKHIPDLLNEDTRDIAIMSLGKFFSKDEITQIAALYSSTKTLNEIAIDTDNNQKTRDKANSALHAIDKKRSDLIGAVFSDNTSNRIASTNELGKNWVNDHQLIPELLEYSKEKFENETGIYNTAVILSRIPDNQILEHTNIVHDFIKTLQQDKENRKLTLSQLKNIKSLLNIQD